MIKNDQATPVSDGKDTFIAKICETVIGLSLNKSRIIIFVAGLISALSFAPIYFFPVLFISFPLLLIMTKNSRSVKESFLVGYIFGLGHFFAGLYWIGNSFAVEPSVPDWAGYLMVAVLAAFLSLFSGMVTGLLYAIHKNSTFHRHLVSMVLTFIILWSLSEWLRGHLFTGFPWNLSGYVWGFSDIMLQSTAIWGIYGLGTITIGLCFIPLLMTEIRLRMGAGICGGALLGFLFLFGLFRLPENIDYVEDVNLRVVQPSIPQQDKWSYQNWGNNLLTFMDMSEGKSADGVTHIIWPETSVLYSLSEEPSRRHLMSKILSDGGTILTGFPRRQRDEDSMRIFNSFIAIDDQGEIQGIYDKSHLVPFGEYIPSFIKNILVPFGFNQIFSGGQDFSEGDGVKTLTIDGLPPVGILICYEVIFPGQVTDSANRPEWLLNITNDAWYGQSTGPYQHLLQSRVRAIEEGMPLVRSANTGVSAIIDPYGRLLNQIPLNEKGVMNNRLPKPLKEITIYSYMKDWQFIIINAMLSILNIMLAVRVTRQGNGH
ncbi:MAG: apolipoprotein N-acyltransferase [Proteobacteria bacterium]|jgi:apolipoprotein N-acyltransferase|nr:apolipoprotein N-acyltransferase [Pseudomonadota bacterium]